jgi:hypothetical protein
MPVLDDPLSAEINGMRYLRDASARCEFLAVLGCLLILRTSLDENRAPHLRSFWNLDRTGWERRQLPELGISARTARRAGQNS